MKVNLVTVVGDFHKNLTLVQMLKHYAPLVDSIYINFYVTKAEGIESCHYCNQLIDYLKEAGAYQNNMNFLTYVGKKFDWDQVTELYNSTTALDKKAYWIIADCDEFQVWPESPRSIAEKCEQRGYSFVTGGFLDRIGEDGQFTEIRSYEDNLDELFPLIGFFRYPMSGACPNKVVMVKGGQRVCSGQHYAVFPDGTNSWGDRHPFRYPINECFVQVHHFKWDWTILKRLTEVSNSDCKYSEEYLKMKEQIQNTKRIDIKNNTYCVERYEPELGYDSYRHWNKIKNIIVKI